MRPSGVVTALACAALQGACGVRQVHPQAEYTFQPVRVHYVERVAIRAPVAPWMAEVVEEKAVADQALFVTEQRSRMDQLSRTVRGQVARGRLSPRALGELRRERAYVDGLLSRYGSDGVLTQNERNHVATSVDQIREIERQPELRRAIGGGPR
jgi:hypothetical protein